MQTPTSQTLNLLAPFAAPSVSVGQVTAPAIGNTIPSGFGTLLENLPASIGQELINIFEGNHTGITSTASGTSFPLLTPELQQTLSTGAGVQTNLLSGEGSAATNAGTFATNTGQQNTQGIFTSSKEQAEIQALLNQVNAARSPQNGQTPLTQQQREALQQIANALKTLEQSIAGDGTTSDTAKAVQTNPLLAAATRLENTAKSLVTAPKQTEAASKVQTPGAFANTPLLNQSTKEALDRIPAQSVQSKTATTPATHNPANLAGAADSATQQASTITPTLSAPVMSVATTMPYGYNAISDGLPQASHAAPAQQIVVNIQKAVKQGLDKIQIQLDPANLGKVEVEIRVPHDGRAQVAVIVDRQETLDMLQRDARGLERALQDAGLKTDSGSLQFNLRGQQEQQNPYANKHGDMNTPYGSAQATEAGEPTNDSIRQYISNNALDITV